jgi:hypothetical protein
VTDLDQPEDATATAAQQENPAWSARSDALFRGKKRSAYAGDPKPTGTPPPGVVEAKIKSNRRRMVAKILSDGNEQALDVLIDNMRWNMQQARREEKLAGDIVTAETMAAIRGFRADATDAATRVAPYFHARLAPKLAKGETGTQINLIIEDA